MADVRLARNQAATFAPLIDALLVALAGWLAFYTRWSRWELPFDYLAVLILGIGLVLVIFPLTGAYRSWRGDAHWRDTGNSLPGLVVVTVGLMIAGTLTKSTAEYSRLWMGYWFVYSIIGLFLVRWLGALLIRRLTQADARGIRVIIIGSGDFAMSVVERARSAQDANWNIVALVSPDSRWVPPAEADLTSMSLGELEAIVEQPEPDIDEVWIAMDNSEAIKQKAIIDLLQASCLTVRYVPDLTMLALLNHMPSEVAGMMVIDLNASPLTGANLLIKAAVDKLVAGVALVVFAPLFIVIAILIRLDSEGPVFFRQKRHGWDGKVIDVLKFRTMRTGDNHADGSKQAGRDDPRITRIGSILRRTSLDELPQFINVMRGDMSVVGPRPHPVALNRDYVRRIDAYMQRHRVKPGITGWAQIHGLRGETETLDKMQARVDYDLYYIEHWSLWLDIRIIARTVLGGWTGKHAY